MDLLASENIWLVYLGLLIGPFVQEDLAVATAAGLSVSHPQFSRQIFLFIFIGLMASDLWKYYLGYFARKHPRMAEFANRPKIKAACEKMKAYPGLALMATRFIPLSRVPAYFAAGFVQLPYYIYAGWIVFSGLIYVILVFSLFHLLGAVLGAKLKTYLPLIALSIAGVTILFLMWKNRRDKSI